MGKESQATFAISLSLYLIICWNVSRAPWVFTEPSSSVSKPAPLPHMIASSSKLLCGCPQASRRPAVGETNQKTNHITRAHLLYKKLYLILSITFLSNRPQKNSSLIKKQFICVSLGEKVNRVVYRSQILKGGHFFPRKTRHPSNRVYPNHHWTGNHSQSKMSDP